MGNYVKFVNGKSYWSDADHSNSDKMKYYKIDPALGLEKGHPFKLVDGAAVPLIKEEMVKHKEGIDRERYIRIATFGLAKKRDELVRTIPAEVNHLLGQGKQEIYYRADIQYNKFLIICLKHLMLKTSSEAELAAKWSLTLEEIRQSEYEKAIAQFPNFTNEQIRDIDPNNAYWYKYLPFYGTPQP